MATTEPRKTQTRRRLQLFLDWDETITAHDTLALIPPPEASNPSFAELGKAYTADLEAFEAKLKTQYERLDPAEVRQQVQEAYALPTHFAAGMSDALCAELARLDALDAVELASVSRTEAGGVFRGWDPAEARQRACSEETVRMRDGWGEVVRWMREQPGLEVHIISVSWSSTFIAAGLESHPSSGLPRASTGLPTTINANDPVLGPDGLGTGKLSKSCSQASASQANDKEAHAGIRTGRHKLAVMRSLSGPASFSSSQPPEEAPPLRIYVGDSSTDLPCILFADIGILIGDKPAMRSKLDALNIKSQDVGAFLAADWHVGRVREGADWASARPEEYKHCVVTAHDWKGLLPLLLATSR